MCLKVGAVVSPTTGPRLKILAQDSDENNDDDEREKERRGEAKR